MKAFWGSTFSWFRAKNAELYSYVKRVVVIA
jgi:hypothetical protein